MNLYVTGSMIKELREKKGYTQKVLADKLMVSEKTISKWESNRGLPDISMIEPLSKILEVSLIELFNGKEIINKNKSANMLKSNFYVCPICGNIIHSIGESVVSCCGITLPVLEAEDNDDIDVSIVENEYYVSFNHEMTKEHYISFIAYLTSDRCEIFKLYPESLCEARFLRRGRGYIYLYCNKDGLFRKKI